jgi:hypothetical protein
MGPVKLENSPGRVPRPDLQSGHNKPNSFRVTRPTAVQGGDIAITFERALTRTRDVEVYFSLPLFPSA